MVQKDFMLTTAADIVADPSAPDAFVQGIMENAEWVLDSDGEWRKIFIKETKEAIYQARRQPSKQDLERVMLESFDKLLKNINKI